MQGDREEFIGESNSEEHCADLVLLRRPSATGATFYGAWRYCYAEFGNHIVGSSTYRTCLFQTTTGSGNIFTTLVKNHISIYQMNF